MEFGILSEAEFTEAKLAHANFLQSIEMYRRYMGMGREAYIVGVRDGEQILAAGLILGKEWRFGKKIFRVAGGWLMDYEGERSKEILKFLSEKAEEFCRTRGGMVLEISPNIVNQPSVKAELQVLGYKYLGEYEQVKWIYVLDLVGKTHDELFKNLRMTHRRLIRRAEREKVQIRELGEGEFSIMKENAAEAGVRHGFRDPEMEYYRSMKEYFGEKVKFMAAEVEIEGEITSVATGMFVEYGGELIYLYGGSKTEYRKYGGSYLLQWRMIERALEIGCQRYNFYGVRPVEGNGVYLFKQGFRGEVEELLGTFAKPLGLIGKAYVAKIRPREMGEVV